MRAHDSRQDNDNRERGFRFFAAAAPAQSRRAALLFGKSRFLRIAGQSLVNFQPLDVLGEQPIAQRRAGGVILKILKVRGLRPLVEQRAPAGLPRDARIHRVGIDH